MSQIIDRRLNGRHKSAVNRQRFLNRYKTHIKKMVAESINKRSITDIDSGETISIPASDIHEPLFRHGNGGRREIVYPGNKQFEKGDRVIRPSGNDAGQGQGVGGSNTGSGTDDFVFQISKDEFLEMYFEDLALPDLIKKQITRIPTFKNIRAGYTMSGSPTNINVIRSLKGSLSRRIALASPYKKELTEVNKKISDLMTSESEFTGEIEALQKKVEFLKQKIKKIPFIDTFDLRYNNRVKEQIPTTQAVMFCIMDVSGSMDKIKKDIAKRFFILLYLFLKRNYQKIDVVFIRHHTSAKEVDEQEFFFSRETGGTVVSSSLQLLKKIIQDRYDQNCWNIYAAQASDGDNWNADSPHCFDLLINDIMPTMQYFAYVEIMPRLHQSLWDAYIKVNKIFSNFSLQTINELSDIYPVFRELFKRQIT
jgi:hypothetical protein